MALATFNGFDVYGGNTIVCDPVAGSGTNYLCRPITYTRK
jgi:hypothetical protein